MLYKFNAGWTDWFLTYSQRNRMTIDGGPYALRDLIPLRPATTSGWHVSVVLNDNAVGTSTEWECAGGTRSLREDSLLEASMP